MPTPEKGRGPLGKVSRRASAAALGLVLLLVLVVLAARALWPDGRVDVRDGTTLVTAKGLEARYGIQVVLVGITAGGGLIDFRYRVVDPDKANPIVHDLDLFPKFVVEETGATLGITSLPHNHKSELKLGGTYFFLLPNANNAVKRESHVTLVIGDERLEHLVVRE